MGLTLCAGLYSVSKSVSPPCYANGKNSNKVSFLIYKYLQTDIRSPFLGSLREEKCPESSEKQL